MFNKKLDKSEMKIITLVALICTLCSSCEQNSDIITGPPVLYPPIVSGIIKTHESGQVFGVIGKPNDNRNGNNISILVLYPNPVNNFFGIMFEHRQQGNIEMWITPANTSNDILMEMTGLGSIIIPNTVNSVQLFSGTLNAGKFNYEFDLRDYINSSAIIGFYRLYLLTEDELLWADLLCY